MIALIVAGYRDHVHRPTSLIKPATAHAAYETETAYANAIGVSTYGYDDATQSKAGGIKCKTSHNRGDWKAGGLVTMRDDLVAQWCWNGNRVTSVQYHMSCGVTTVGSIPPFFMDEEVQESWGRYRNWNGSPYGEFQVEGRCRYQQHIAWYQGPAKQMRYVSHLRGNGNVVRERHCEAGC